MEQSNMHCVKCRANTATHDHKLMQTKNGKYRLNGICNVCGSRKSQFISNQMGEGLISGLLGFKDGFPLLNRIPILGQLL